MDTQQKTKILLLVIILLLAVALLIFKIEWYQILEESCSCPHVIYSSLPTTLPSDLNISGVIGK